MSINHYYVKIKKNNLSSDFQLNFFSYFCFKLWIIVKCSVPKCVLEFFLYIYQGADVIEWSRALDGKAKRMVLQCINGVSSNPVEGRTKI